MTRPGVLFVLLFAAATVSAQPLTRWELPDVNSNPDSIAAAPDGTVWFSDIDANKIGRITTDGRLTEFTLPIRLSRPQGIVITPDGMVWIAESNASQIGRMTPSGQLTEFPVAGNPFRVCASADGTIFFTESQLDRIGRIAKDGTFVDFPVTRGRMPWACAVDPAGNVWFTERYARAIGKLSPSGVVTDYPMPSDAFGSPDAIVIAPDGTVTLMGARMVTDGVFTAYSTGSVPADAFVLDSDLTFGADGSLWMTQRYYWPNGALNGAIIRVDPHGAITKYPVRDGLPAGIAVDRSGGIWTTVYPGLVLRLTPFARRRAAGAQ